MSKSLVQQQFGANAGAYVDSAPHAKGASLTRLVEVVQPQAGWQALDIATGAGHTAIALAPHVASVIASDVTPEMLDEAESLAASKGLANVTTASADAEDLPWPDSSFDLVTCRIAAHHFPDPPRFIAEAHRVLRDAGTFVLIDNISPDLLSTPGFAKTELKEAAIAYNTFEKLRDPSHVRALTLAEWLEVLDDAGFDVQHQEIQPKAMDFKAWIGRQAAAADTAARLEEMVRTAAPALKAFLRPRSDASGLWFTLDEVMIVARKRGRSLPE